jgi:hypothetical protein
MYLSMKSSTSAWILAQRASSCLEVAWRRLAARADCSARDLALSAASRRSVRWALTALETGSHVWPL